MSSMLVLMYISISRSYSPCGSPSLPIAFHTLSTWLLACGTHILHARLQDAPERIFISDILRVSCFLTNDSITSLLSMADSILRLMCPLSSTSQHLLHCVGLSLLRSCPLTFFNSSLCIHSCSDRWLWLVKNSGHGDGL